MKSLLTCALLVLPLTMPGAVRAAGGHRLLGRPACGCCAVAGPQLVERTIYVPEVQWETRTVVVTRYVNEPRQRREIVYRSVPESHPVTQQYTALVPEVRQRTEQYVACVPVTRMVSRTVQVCVPEWREEARQVQVRVPTWRTVSQQYTAMVPHQEVRQGVRTVCKMLPVTSTRVVTRDEGHWEERVVAAPCPRRHRRLLRAAHATCCAPKPCPGHTWVKKVWIPNLVSEEVPVTVLQPHYVEEEYQYTVTVCKPEVRTRNVRVCEYRLETRTQMHRVCDYRWEQRTQQVPVTHFESEIRTRQVSYTVCVPQTRTRTVYQTTYKQVPEERIIHYTECVPQQVEEQIQVPVCTLVPKTVRVCVRACGC